MYARMCPCNVCACIYVCCVCACACVRACVHMCAHACVCAYTTHQSTVYIYSYYDCTNTNIQYDKGLKGDVVITHVLVLGIIF